MDVEAFVMLVCTVVLKLASRKDPNMAPSKFRKETHSLLL